MNDKYQKKKRNEIFKTTTKEKDMSVILLRVTDNKK